MKICKVKGEYIQLNQLLKLENIVATDGEARQLIEHGMVYVNGGRSLWLLPFCGRCRRRAAWCPDRGRRAICRAMRRALSWDGTA